MGLQRFSSIDGAKPNTANQGGGTQHLDCPFLTGWRMGEQWNFFKQGGSGNLCLAAACHQNKLWRHHQQAFGRHIPIAFKFGDIVHSGELYDAVGRSALATHPGRTA